MVTMLPRGQRCRGLRPLACILLLGLAASVESTAQTLGALPDQSTHLRVAPTPGNPSRCAGLESYASGRSYNVVIASPADGELISFNVFEPATVDCARKHALVLQASGLGGSKYALSERAVFAPLLDRGLAAISFDQRGQGSSTGQKRLMDPHFESRDGVAIIDWAEANLNWVRRRGNGVIVGTFGSSYGGAYQPGLNAVDPKGRIAAMVLMSTWHSLPNLFSANGVVNHTAVAVIEELGTVSQRMISTEVGLAKGTPNDQHGSGWHPSIQALLARLAGETRIDADSVSMLSRRDASEFCGNTRAAASSLEAEFGLPAPGSPSYHGALRPVPTLVAGAPQDSLFSMQEMDATYRCVKARGAPAYYVGAWAAHAPPGKAAAGTSGAIDPLQVGDWHPPAAACGSLHALSYVDFFDEYLNGATGAFSAQWAGNSVCIPSANDNSRVFRGTSVPAGGTTFAIPATSFPAGITGYYVKSGPVVAIPLAVSTGSFDVIGEPLLEIELENFDPRNCAPCDPTLFVALGLAPDNGGFQALNGKVTPVTGLGRHNVRLAGVAGTFRPGQRLYLLVYNFSPAFGADAVRQNQATPFLSISGSLSAPIVGGTAEPIVLTDICEETSSTTLWRATASEAEELSPQAYAKVYGVPAVNNTGEIAEGDAALWGNYPALQKQLRAANLLAGGAALETACSAPGATPQNER